MWKRPHCHQLSEARGRGEGVRTGMLRWRRHRNQELAATACVAPLEAGKHQKQLLQRDAGGLMRRLHEDLLTAELLLKTLTFLLRRSSSVQPISCSDSPVPCLFLLSECFSLFIYAPTACGVAQNAQDNVWAWKLRKAGSTQRVQTSTDFCIEYSVVMDGETLMKLSSRHVSKFLIFPLNRQINAGKNQTKQGNQSSRWSCDPKSVSPRSTTAQKVLILWSICKQSICYLFSPFYKMRHLVINRDARKCWKSPTTPRICSGGANDFIMSVMMSQSIRNMIGCCCRNARSRFAAYSYLPFKV